ncbi:MAG: hypothetical protein QHH30_09860 [candidate division NC10 bacterium]|nr:hypothetical protein [candidate division NC10 bacterium]
MQDRVSSWGEVSIRIPGVCLSPSHLRSLSERRIKRKGRLAWSKPRQVAEELLFVPYYFFRYTNPRHRRRFYLYDVLVDGILGFPEFIRGPFELRPISVRRESLLERTLFQGEAEPKAKQLVASYALRRQSLWVKKIEVELIEAEEFHFPYWVCYLETRRGIDLFALNGLTGASAGPRSENVLRAGIARSEWQRDRS